MEVSATQGILTLIATMILFVMVFIAITLLFNKRVRAVGLLLIFLVLSVAASVATYLSWKYGSGANDIAQVWSSLLLPLFGISASTALLIRYLNNQKLKPLNVLIKESVRSDGVLTIKVLVMSVILMELLGVLMGFDISLVVPIALSVLVAVNWNRIKNILNI